jgi:hypothetical protein
VKRRELACCVKKKGRRRTCEGLPALSGDELASDREESLTPANEKPQDSRDLDVQSDTIEETDNQPIAIGLVVRELAEPPGKFTSLRDALRHVVEVLIPNKHTYIVHWGFSQRRLFPPHPLKRSDLFVVNWSDLLV